MVDLQWSRKYRPTAIDDYIGNKIRERVKSRYRTSPLPQVVFIEGASGCGKTTLARILAKEYLCWDKAEGGLACGKCPMCKELEEYAREANADERLEGLYEIDYTGNEGKIQQTEEILESVERKPLPPLRYKVLIMDEFHRASQQVQSRLLKIMEQPPKHLVFILCTTNPEQVLDTIKNRCNQTYHITKASPSELQELLTRISKAEGVRITGAAIEQLMLQSDYSVRMSINRLEELAKSRTGNEEITSEAVNSLGTTIVDISLITRYYQAGFTGLESTLSIVQELKERDISPEQFLDEVIKYTITDLKISVGCKQSVPKEHLLEYGKLFKLYNTNQILYILQLLEQTQYRMKLTVGRGADQRMNQELLLVNLSQRIGRVGVYVSLSDTNTKGSQETKQGETLYAESNQVKTQHTDKLQVDLSKIIGTGLGLAKFGTGLTEVVQDPSSQEQVDNFLDNYFFD